MNNIEQDLNIDESSPKSAHEMRSLNILKKLNRIRGKNLEVTQQIYQSENERAETLHKSYFTKQTMRSEIRSEVNNIKALVKKRYEATLASKIPTASKYASIRIVKTEDDANHKALLNFCNDSKAFLKFKKKYIKKDRSTLKKAKLLNSKSAVNISKEISRHPILPELRNMKLGYRQSKEFSYTRKISCCFPSKRNKNTSREMIDIIINKCDEEEKAAKSIIKESSKAIRLAVVKSDVFRKTSQRISKLEYAEPGLMHYLYFQKQKEKEFLYDQLSEIRSQSTYRSGPKGRLIRVNNHKKEPTS